MGVKEYNLDLNKVYESDFQKLYYLGNSKGSEKHFLYGIREEKPPFIYVEDNEGNVQYNRLERTIRKILPNEVDELLGIITNKENELFNDRLDKYLRESSISKEYNSVTKIIENKDLFRDYLVDVVKTEEEY